jgi:hypothetical protein
MAGDKETDNKNNDSVPPEEDKSKKEKEPTPLFNEADIFKALGAYRKIKETINEKNPDRIKEEEERKLIEEERKSESDSISYVINILMEDIEKEKDPDEKQNLKKQLLEKVKLYIQLKKAREDKENSNKSSIDWEKVIKVIGVTLEEASPFIIKLILSLVQKKK